MSSFPASEGSCSAPQVLKGGSRYMKTFVSAVNGTGHGTKLLGQSRASLVPGTSLGILHKSTLPDVKRT